MLGDSKELTPARAGVSRCVMANVARDLLTVAPVSLAIHIKGGLLVPHVPAYRTGRGTH